MLDSTNIGSSSSSSSSTVFEAIQTGCRGQRNDAGSSALLLPLATVAGFSCNSKLIQDLHSWGKRQQRQSQERIAGSISSSSSYQGY